MGLLDDGVLAFSQPLLSSREACVLTYGLQSGEGALTNSLHSLGSAAGSLTGVTWGPMKRAGGARQGGPSRGFLPGSAVPCACQVPRVSKLEKRFQSEAFALLGRFLKACLALAAPGRSCKRLFLFMFLNGDILGEPFERASVSWRTLEAGPLGWATGGSRPGRWGRGERRAGAGHGRRLENVEPVPRKSV